jgi:hypothetical protein|tara:strand:- start:3667 stop:3831 length:165 start_codon:yes stop_codon:yes gene_type:complete
MKMRSIDGIAWTAAILEAGNDSFRFKASAAVAARKKREGNRSLECPTEVVHQLG